MIVRDNMDWAAWEKREDAAWKQANEPNFSTRNNPLVTETPAQAAQREVVERNMNSLRADARKRENPRTGAVYSGIMNMRYGG